MIRLDRDTLTESAPFGSAVYSKEELIAEFGSAFLCGHTGIINLVENQASYIDNWRRVLRADAHMVIQAASAGQKAADYILDVGV